MTRFLFVQILKLKWKENWKLRVDLLPVYGIAVTFRKTTPAFFHLLILSSSTLSLYSSRDRGRGRRYDEEGECFSFRLEVQMFVSLRILWEQYLYIQPSRSRVGSQSN